MSEEESKTIETTLQTPPSITPDDGGDTTNKIVVKKRYFDDIQTSINSLNEFFSSNYQTKNFPMLDGEQHIDPVVNNILTTLNNVDPTWIDDTSKSDKAIDKVINVGKTLEGRGYVELLNRNDTETITEMHSLIGFLLLQYISLHFEEFQKLINGIFSMQIFMKPSEYGDVITVFGKPLDSDIEHGLSELYPDASFTLFTIDDYVRGLFKITDLITFPDTMTEEEEIKRMYAKQDLQGFSIVVDDTIQEAAEINYFTNTKPPHIKYNPSSQKFSMSVQFKSLADELIGELKKCNTTSDLKTTFQSLDKKYPETMASVVMPFILANAFNNEKKYQTSFNRSDFKKYIDSYESISSHNHGADRYADNDIFSTFKADKNGTIKFIEDFLKLNLVNDESCSIKNNTLLRLFNIYDSRIYLDIMYNMIPDDTRDLDENTFVTQIRARINKNSKNTNVYSDESKAPEEDNKTPTTDEVQEYAFQIQRQFGSMSIDDMILCEQYHALLRDELNTLPDCIYRSKISISEIESYIGESFNVVQEIGMGNVPDYIHDRFGVDDENPVTAQQIADEISLEKVKPVETTPDNSFNDLANSIDNKLNTPGDLYDSLGTGYETNPNRGNNTVYNINYNYSNSFNKDSNNRDSHDTKKQTLTNDLSSGKTVTSTNTNSFNKTKTNSDNDSSTNKKDDNSVNKNISTNTDEGNQHLAGNPTLEDKLGEIANGNIPPATNIDDDTMDDDFNNNSNSNDSLDTEDSDTFPADGEQELSSGMTLQEMFLFLESDEPPSGGNGAMPKQDMLTTAMDNDRKLLKAQQSAKRGVQYGVNTSKAAFRPIVRTRAWLTKMADSLIKRDEDKVKREFTENPSYRTAIFKAGKLCLSLGLFATAATINGWLAAFLVGIALAKGADKQRLRNEVQRELMTEVKIIDEKIKVNEEQMHSDKLHIKDAAEKRKYQLMRQRADLIGKMQQVKASAVKAPATVAQ